MHISTDLHVSSKGEGYGPRGRARTQAERRAETRTALLEATIACLVEYGYANTTTGRIAELAGVSRGAQVSYFRTRIELVASAVSYLAEKRVAVMQVRLAAGPVTIEQALDVLWEEHQGVLFHAALELWVASRSDAELRTVMHRVEHEVALSIMRVAETAIGDRARRPGFADDLVFVLATIRGLALLQISTGRTGGSPETWTQARERLVRTLA